jgi:transposase-like protein
MDETGWRIGGEKAWLWVAASDDATLYDVARGRGFEEATGLVRDGWVVYNS